MIVGGTVGENRLIVLMNATRLNAATFSSCPQQTPIIARCHVVAKFIVVVYIGYSTRRAVIRALSGPEVCCISP